MASGANKPPRAVRPLAAVPPSIAGARELLQSELRPGPRPAAEIAAAAGAAGVPPSALRRARVDLGVTAEKKGFGAGGGWLLSLGPAGAPPDSDGSSAAGWGLLAASAASFGLAYLCNEANRAAAERGGCPQAATAGFPAPPGAEPKDCCPRWFIVALVLAGVILAILGLAKL